MERSDEDVLDELLVLDCQAGDVDALQRLVDRWQERLSRYAGRLTRDQDAVADVVQEAWIAIARGLGRLDDPARFRGWAYRIVTNKAVDWIRRRQRQRTLKIDLAGQMNREAEDDEDLCRIREAMNSMPDEQRHLLLLHYVEGLSLDEIAEALSIPAGTVKSRLFHCRKKLKTLIERDKT